jgi:hypothetical protein
MRDAFQPAPDLGAPLRRPAGDRYIFLPHRLRDPLGIGAAQSGRERVAREVAVDRPGAVLELGGVTRGSDGVFAHHPDANSDVRS